MTDKSIEGNINPINLNSNKENEESGISTNTQSETSQIELSGQGLYISYQDPVFRKFLSSVYSKDSRQLDSIIPNDYFILESNHIKNVYKAIVEEISLRDGINRPDYFTIKLYFENGSRDTIHFIKDIEDYNSVDIPIIKIEIIWTYYIRFPSRPNHERQEINLTIDTDINKSDKFYEKEKVIKRNKRTSLFSFLDENEDYASYSRIKLSINYTEFNWASAIENQISKKLVSCTKEIPGWRKTIYRYSNSISTITSMTLLLCSLRCITILNNIKTKLQLEEFIDSSKSSLDISEKIDGLIDITIIKITEELTTKSSFGFIFFVSIFVTAIVFLCLDTNISKLIKPFDKSFILISDNLTNEKEKYYNRHKNSVWYLALTFTFAVVAGIVAAFIDHFLQWVHLFPALS